MHFLPMPRVRLFILAFSGRPAFAAGAPVTELGPPDFTVAFPTDTRYHVETPCPPEFARDLSPAFRAGGTPEISQERLERM